MTPSLIISFFLPQLLLLPPPVAGGGGRWSPLLSNIGISAMHMQLLHTDRVVIFDRTDFGPSNISLPHRQCRRDPFDTALTLDCTAHSVEYDVASNSVRPLTVLTDVWCSSGAVNSAGNLVQAGGFNDGDRAVRVYRPCEGDDDSSCDWEEIKTGLAQRRWYATSQRLPDGRQIIVGGRRQSSYEFYPKTGDGAYNLPFLVETNDQKIENNLYPFVFLNEDGNLFIFANNRAILFDYKTRAVVRRYPTIPGGEPRSYPSTGSAVLLPLDGGGGGVGEVLICGGAPKGAFVKANNGEFVSGLNTCGRIRINDPDPKWVVESMPWGRVMGDMLLLPNGNVLIINGAGAGTAGWELGRKPVLSPLIYYPDKEVGSRFEVQNPSSTPRLYHSSAILLRDGRVLVGGNNPHTYYNFTGVLFPTDLTLESFSPPYLDIDLADLRPVISSISDPKFGYGKEIGVQFMVPSKGIDNGSIMVTMIAPSFNTHSFSMNQRLLVLERGDVENVARSTYKVQVVAPASGNLAPAGYYLLFVVHKDIPSEGIWIHIQ